MTFKLPWFAIVGVLAVAVTARAVIMKPFSIGELTGKSDVVVHGKVVSTTCQRDAEGRIYTSVKLDVEEVLKGNVDTNTFRIIHGGGTLGDEIQSCSAQVEFGIGEEIVAMLVLNERGEGVVLGLVQGKFEVNEDKQTGEKFAHNVFHGRPETKDTSPHRHAAQSNVTDTAKDKLSLKDLKREIKGGGK